MKISVKVKTRTSQNKLMRNADGTYAAYLTSSPVKGEANRSLIELISEEFDVPKSSIRIAKGLTSKNKVVYLGE